MRDCQRTTSARSTASRSYYLRRTKFGGVRVSDAKRLKEFEAENARLKKLLADSLLEKRSNPRGFAKKW